MSNESLWLWRILNQTLYDPPRRGDPSWINGAWIAYFLSLRVVYLPPSSPFIMLSKEIHTAPPEPPSLPPPLLRLPVGGVALGARRQTNALAWRWLVGEGSMCTAKICILPDFSWGGTAKICMLAGLSWEGQNGDFVVDKRYCRTRRKWFELRGSTDSIYIIHNKWAWQIMQ